MSASSPIDLIDTLLEQHERIRELLADIERDAQPEPGRHDTKDAALGPRTDPGTDTRTDTGGSRAAALEELRELLALHETGEEYLATPGASGAARLTDALDRLDPRGPGFAARFAAFAAQVREHVDREERDEFPAARAAHSPDELHDLGNKLLKAERGTLGG